MADNVELNAGSGGAVVGTEDVGGVHYQIIKVANGGDGVASLIGSANPMDVINRANGGVDIGDVTVNNAAGAGSIPVQGAVAVDGALAQNPVLLGGRASTATPSAVSADDDVQAIWVSRTGAVQVGDAGSSLSIDDGGNVITVDGTVAVSSVGGTVTVDGSGVTQPVSGTVTIQDGGNTITVDGTVAVTNAGLTELAAAIDTELQVDVVGALPAGTNNIGDVDIASIAAGDNNIGNVDVVSLPALAAGTNNIGDVDVLSVVPGTGATALGKAIDSAAGATDTGVALLAVRDDALSTLTPVDGDYVPLRVNDEGALHVVSTGGAAGTEYTEGATDATITGVAILWEDAADTLATVSAATPLPVEIIAGAGSGGTAMTDDAAFTPGTTSVTPMGAMFDDVAPDSVNEGDGGVVRMSANRNLYATIRDAAGNERGLNIDASGNIAVTQSGTWNVGTVTTVSTVTSVTAIGTSVTPGTSAAHLGKAVDSAAGSTDTGVLALVVRDDALATLTPADNDYTQLRVTSTGRLWASATIDAALPAGTNNIGDVDVLSIAAGDNNIGNVDIVSLPASTNTIEVVGDAAHDAAAAGNPLLMGAEADETSPDAVDEGDVGRLRISLERFLVTTPRPTATGEGLDIFRSLDLDETEEAVKASAGKVYGYTFFNAAAAIRYLKFYNDTTANVTVGSTTPVMTIGIPAGAAGHVPWDHGIAFSAAITVAATTGIADNDSGAPAANDVSVQVFYK